jgi:hypothetical protein
MSSSISSSVISSSGWYPIEIEYTGFSTRSRRSAVICISRAACFGSSLWKTFRVFTSVARPSSVMYPTELENRVPV